MWVGKWIPSKFLKINTTVFILSVVLTALIWGIGFANFMNQTGEANAKLLMVMCTVGLCSGGVMAYIPELRLSMVFCFLMLVPAVMLMGLHHINMPLAAALVLFLIYLCFIAYRANREYWDALENEHLLEKKSKDLEIISRIDGLTGLYNRRYFDEAFSFEWNRAVRNKTSLSVMIGDVDQFKRVNDQYGHLAGDEYLKSLGGLFKDVFKRKTDIIARYGGEEFIALMPNESAENTRRLAETIRSMTESFQLEYEDHTIQTTISIGIAINVPHQHEKREFLISKADRALYQSKTSGRNKVSVKE